LVLTQKSDLEIVSMEEFAAGIYLVRMRLLKNEKYFNQLLQLAFLKHERIIVPSANIIKKNYSITVGN